MESSNTTKPKSDWPSALVAVVGVVLVGLAVYWTKSGTPLWGLILVAGLVEELKN